MIIKTPPEAIDFGLLANFTHQVINPLNGVSGTIGNLLDGTIEPHRREQRLRAARAQLEHSILLVRNLAYFSQISLDPRNTNPDATSKTCVLPQIIIEAAMFFQELAAHKGMKIDLLDRNTQYRIEGNPDLLRQVFMNLFDNAVKYGNRDSEVKITPWVQKHTGNLLVKIEGSSPPVPASERDSIFRLGYRGASAKSKIASGTGLGLHICRTIIEEVHGGSIEVESSTANGTTSFIIRFPSFVIGPDT